MRSAIVFGLLPFIISFSSASYVNGARVAYRDYSAILFGILAVVCACLAIRPLRSASTSIGPAIGALALGGFQLLRGFGVV